MSALNSINCAVVKRLLRRSRNSGATRAGVAVMASANSSTSFSSASNRSLSACQFRLRICSSLIPAILPPAELMSIQKGHSTSCAARNTPSLLRRAGTRLVVAKARLNLSKGIITPGCAVKFSKGAMTRPRRFLARLFINATLRRVNMTLNAEYRPFPSASNQKRLCRKCNFVVRNQNRGCHLTWNDGRRARNNCVPV